MITILLKCVVFKIIFSTLHLFSHRCIHSKSKEDLGEAAFGCTCHCCHWKPCGCVCHLCQALWPACCPEVCISHWCHPDCWPFHTWNLYQSDPGKPHIDIWLINLLCYILICEHVNLQCLIVDVWMMLHVCRLLSVSPVCWSSPTPELTISLSLRPPT